MNSSVIKSKKILQVGIGLTTSNGGINKSVEQFDQALGGTSVISFSTRRDFADDKSSGESRRHLLISELPLLSNFGYASTQEVAGLIKSAGLVICHVMFRYHAIWVYQHFLKYGIPYWFVPHGQLDPYVFTYQRLAKNLWMHLIGKRLLYNSTFNIFSTNREMEKAEKFLRNDNSVVIPWAVETPSMTVLKSRNEIRAELGIRESDKVFLYFGRLHPMKRPLETIRAISNSGMENAHLIMLGNPSGVSGESCYALAKELGFAKRFHFLGPVFGQKKYGYVHASDVYVSLSHRENFNFTAVEAMATGLPVILSIGNDIYYDLGTTEFAVKVDPEDSCQLNSTLKEFISMDKSRLKELGRQSKDHVNRNYSFNKFASSLKDLVSLSWNDEL